MRKWFYDAVYRFLPADLVFGSTAKIEGFVDAAVDGRVAPCRALTLGCGVGRESVHLARKGFEVTGVDFSPNALRRARGLAQAAGVEVTFVEDDLTALRHIEGTWDLITDFGAFNDLNQHQRDRYMENVVPLTSAGSHYVMFCFDWMLSPDEVGRRFDRTFTRERLLPRGPARFGRLTLYAMRRRSEDASPG